MISRRFLMQGAAWRGARRPGARRSRRTCRSAPRRSCGWGSSRSSGRRPSSCSTGRAGPRQAGLELHFITFESGPNMIQALASGTLDVYVAGVAPLAVARAKGIDVRVVTATAVEEIVMVGRAQARRPTSSPACRPARRWRPSQGTRARRPASRPSRQARCPTRRMQHWLWEVGKADKADVEIVPMGIDATQQALLTGAVDGATMREPAVTIVTQRDPRIKIVALGGEMFPNQPGHGRGADRGHRPEGSEARPDHRRPDRAGRST